MKAVVVYESIYGNTRAIAQAIADGLGGAQVVPVYAADGLSADLLVVGAPTHVHGIPTTRSRQVAAEAAHEDGDTHIEPGAIEQPGLRVWLRDLPDGDGRCAATFDTRLDRAPWFTGLASRGIAKRLRRRGYELLGSESFLVEDTEGPLADGELDRARDWGHALVESLALNTGQSVG